MAITYQPILQKMGFSVLFLKAGTAIPSTNLIGTVETMILGK